jgi:hypothetical protein
MADVGVRSPLTSPAYSFLTDLRSDLRSARNFLKVFSLNVQSIVPELTELRTFLVPSLFHILAFRETFGLSRGIPMSWLPLMVLMCFVVIVLGRLVVVWPTKAIKATLAYKSAAGSYFEYVLISFRFNDVSVLVGFIYNPDRLHFDEVKAFLDLLALVSLNFDHLIVLGDFNFDILIF